MGKKVQSESVDPTVQVAYINRRGTVITAVCGVIVALVGAFAAYSAGRKQSTDTTAPPTVTVVKTITATASAAAPASDVVQAPSAVSAQVWLNAGTGVDIDAADPRAVEASGANGDLDMYFSEGKLSVTRWAIYSYHGKESDAKVECPRVVANDRSYTSGPFIPNVGEQFCLRTTNGTVGWLNINDLSITVSPTDYMVINYQLFG